jgi:DNA-binding NtrC family response regulator
MQRLRAQLQRLGPYFRTALIRGESGTGRDLVAQILHHASPAAKGPFVTFNASSVSNSVIEEEGATPALAPNPDDLEQLLKAAHRGTIYFDEVGEMPEAMQAQLLATLRRQERLRIGTSPIDQLQCRIIASTSQDLHAMSATGDFRPNLYERLAMIEISLTPLRERSEDIPALAEHFLNRDSAWRGHPQMAISPTAIERLQSLPWRGNVRELESTLRLAAENCEGTTIEEDQLLFAYGSRDHATMSSHGIGRTPRLHEVVKQHVFHVLRECGGNKVRAAELLGISRSTLYRMIDSGSTGEYTTTMR